MTTECGKRSLCLGRLYREILALLGLFWWGLVDWAGEVLPQNESLRESELPSQAG